MITPKKKHISIIQTETKQIIIFQIFVGLIVQKIKKNKSSNLDVVYEFVDSIDDDAIEITDYNENYFESYYYVESSDSFYFCNGVNYRKLHINTSKKGFKSIYAISIENKQVQISLNKFKILYGIQI